ncbi:hypothetical protein FB192DRAFT_1356644 [Mucor lusitanicus]|uniref:Secreted protein n=1 Tax=Mucor circinelloides f. lusitanicus TaxID=29924 RepID=A0A8H4BT50_MUCCL|nr:hypothetical protein FB192DRAFT_1356644 [Mucor lusitanicus]
MIIALLSLQAMTVSSWIKCHCCLLEIGALVKPPLSSQLNRHAVRDVEFSKRTSRSIRLLISKCQSCRVFGLFGDFGQFDEQHNDGEFDSDNDKSISSSHVSCQANICSGTRTLGFNFDELLASRRHQAAP